MSTNLSKLLIDARINKAEVARRLGVNKSTLTRWAANGVPAGRVVDFEAATGIPRQAVRPELYISRAPAREEAR